MKTSFSRKEPKLHTPVTYIGRDFIACGAIGLFTEICFTAMHALKCRDFRLKGTTSLWMFPIYGCGAVIFPLSRFLQQKKTPVIVRGMVYTCCIFTVEYLSGKSLRDRDLCPWDYRHSHFHVNGLIRIDYAPCWFLFGLFLERLLPYMHKLPVPKKNRLFSTENTD